MSLSPESSSDESRVAERQLYRAGQTTPAPKPAAVKPPPWVKPTAPKPKPSVSVQNGQPSFFKRIRKGLLAVLALLLMGGVSYCIFLPDPVEEAKRELSSVFKDKSLTREQRGEKLKNIFGSLSEKQKNDMGKERMQKGLERTREFFKLPKNEQVAKMKKDIVEGEKRMAEWRAKSGNRGGNGGPAGAGAAAAGGAGAGRGAGAAGGAGGAGGRGAGVAQGGGPRGGPGGGGPWGGGRGGNGNERQKNGLDRMSPEDRAQSSLYRQMRSQMRQEMGYPSGGFGGGGPRGR